MSLYSTFYYCMYISSTPNSKLSLPSILYLIKLSCSPMAYCILGLYSNKLQGFSNGEYSRSRQLWINRNNAAGFARAIFLFSSFSGPFIALFAIACQEVDETKFYRKSRSIDSHRECTLSSAARFKHFVPDKTIPSILFEGYLPESLVLVVIPLANPVQRYCAAGAGSRDSWMFRAIISSSNKG